MTDPIVLVVPFPPGGSTDLTARILAPFLEARWSRPVVVETTPGENAAAAVESVVGRSPGDAFLVGTINTNSIAPVVAETASFDPSTLTPLTHLADFPSVLATAADDPETDLAAVLARLRSGPGRIRYSTDFLGTNVDVDMLLLARAAGLGLAYRPAAGALEILADLEEGRTDLCILNVATMAAHRGRYRPLAVTAARRLDAFPDVPTFREAGYPHVGTVNWQGLFAHHRLPEGERNRLHADVVVVMERPEVTERFEQAGPGS